LWLQPAATFKGSARLQQAPSPLQFTGERFA